MTTDRTHEEVVAPIDETWRSWNGIHGGYVLALAAGVSHVEGQAPFPQALRGTFLTPVPAGKPVTARVVALREGRSSSEARIELHTDEAHAVDVIASLDKARVGPDFEWSPAPEVARPDDCAPFGLPVDLIPFACHIEVRPTDGARPLGGGDAPELTAWVRLLGAELAPWQVVTVILDALPPALYAVATAPAAIPTTMLSVLLTQAARTCDPDGWSLVRIRTDVAAGGWAVETASAWNHDGILLGHASQQRKVLSPLHGRERP